MALSAPIRASEQRGGLKEMRDGFSSREGGAMIRKCKQPAVPRSSLAFIASTPLMNKLMLTPRSLFPFSPMDRIYDSPS